MIHVAWFAMPKSIAFAHHVWDEWSHALRTKNDASSNSIAATCFQHGIDVVNPWMKLPFGGEFIPPMHVQIVFMLGMDDFLDLPHEWWALGLLWSQTWNPGWFGEFWWVPSKWWFHVLLKGYPPIDPEKQWKTHFRGLLGDGGMNSRRIVPRSVKPASGRVRLVVKWLWQVVGKEVKCHKVSQSVTKCHKVSQSVAKCHKVSQ